jgi:hypothetical protein
MDPDASLNPFYDNEDLKSISPDDIHVERAIDLLRQLRGIEARKARPFLWMRSQWLTRGTPVVLKNCKIEKTGGEGEFRLTAVGKVDVEAIRRQVPEEFQAKVTGLPHVEGPVVIFPSAETLDEQITSSIAPFYAVRGGVESLEIFLGIPAPWEDKKEKKYLEILREQGEDIQSPRDFD